MNSVVCISGSKTIGWNSLSIKLIIYYFRTGLFVSRYLPPVLHDEERIERVQYTKFLGVVIDEHLDWSQHIKEVCLKLSRTCGILYKIRKQLTTDAMLSIHYTLAYPFLCYYISVWGCTWPSFLKYISCCSKKSLEVYVFY